MPPKKRKDEDEEKKLTPEEVVKILKKFDVADLEKVMLLLPEKDWKTLTQRDTMKQRLRKVMSSSDIEDLSKMEKPKPKPRPPPKRRPEPESNEIIVEEDGNAQPDQFASRKRRKTIPAEEAARIKALKEKVQGHENIAKAAKKEARDAQSQLRKDEKEATKKRLEAERLEKLAKEKREVAASVNAGLPQIQKSAWLNYAKANKNLKNAQKEKEEKEKKVKQAKDLADEKAKAAQAAEEQLRLEKIHIKRLPRELVEKLKPYKIDLALVQDWNISDVYDNEANRVLNEVFDELESWSLSRIMDGIWEFLESLAAAYRLKIAEIEEQNTKTTEDDREVGRQVRIIAGNAYGPRISDSEKSFWLVRLAERINRLQGPENDKDDEDDRGDFVSSRDEISTEFGFKARTKKARTFNAYLHAEAGGKAEYEKILKTHDLLWLRRRRRYWINQKHLGSKLKELVDQMGWGILAILTSSSKLSQLDKWNNFRTRAMAHGLQHHEVFAKDWKKICRYFEDWLPSYYLNDRNSPMAVVKRNHFAKAFATELSRMAQGKREAAGQSLTFSVDDVLDQWPAHASFALHGNDFITVDREHVTTLRNNGWLSETAVNAVAASMTTSLESDIRILPAGVVTMQHGDDSINFDEVRRLIGAAREFIVPLNEHNRHWAMMAINLDDQTVRYYDSMNPNDFRDVNGRIQRFLRQAGFVGSEDQDFRFIQREVQQQANGNDCGIHMLANMESVYRGRLPQMIHVAHTRRQFAGQLLAELHNHQRMLTESQTSRALSPPDPSVTRQSDTPSMPAESNEEAPEPANADAGELETDLNLSPPNLGQPDANGTVRTEESESD